MHKIGSMLALVAVLTLGACGTMDNRTGSTYSGSGYGVVQSIELVQGDSSIGLGTVAGGVVGGLLGSQIGEGRGSTAAAIGGAAAGAYVGHQMEKGKGSAYKFTIRMDDGSYQTVTQSSSGDFRVGDRVRIENGTLLRP
jgi:outer membrane lipoprotein SlyB